MSVLGVLSVRQEQAVWQPKQMVESAGVIEEPVSVEELW
jgi:hypothetical protein